MCSHSEAHDSVLVLLMDSGTDRVGSPRAARLFMAGSRPRAIVLAGPFPPPHRPPIEVA